MPAGNSEHRVKSQERFNEVFNKYSDAQKKKKVKKKSAETQETIVLQNLTKSLNLEKDTEDDEAILQNTYHPEQGSPRYSKNKQREKETVEKINLNNQEDLQTSKPKRTIKRDLPPLPPSKNSSRAQEDVEVVNSDSAVEKTTVDRGKGEKQKSKKGKNKKPAEAKEESQVLGSEDRLQYEYLQQIAEEDAKTLQKSKIKTDEESTVSQTMTLNNDVGKKKKKKLKTSQSDDGERVEDAEHSADADNENEPKGKKKKKKKHLENETSSTEHEEPSKPEFDDSLVLGVFVHRTDRLKNDLLMSHPMVKIHVVDESTGYYVKKEDCHRQVSSFYEHENVDHILPIMSQPFDFKKNKSVVPEWQEQIIFNERFGYFVEQRDDRPKVLLFFEILDFISMEEARANVDVDKHERGFRKIAWAFLKIVGTNGVLNIDSKLRLQLYCPPPRAKRQPKTIEAFEWWRMYPRNKYPSTLYVTVKGIKLPEHVDPSIRSMMALQEERGSTSYSELQHEITKRSLTHSIDNQPAALKWSRLPGQVCRIPNKPMLTFRGGQLGCLTVLFSHAGTMLAAACADRDSFPVVVYEIPSGRVLTAFSGHLKVVYDLCWSSDDHSLLSASSDGTVKEWNVERLLEAAQKVLPHPSFVYCSQYHPTAQNLVLTGGYDTVVRVWRLDVDEVNGQLLEEFEGHSSFINTLCFDAEGRQMFSADNTGLIIVWKTSVSQDQQLDPCHQWCIDTKINEKDLSGVPINTLQLHPNGRYLLIHAKDSVLRMMDLRFLAMKKYIGATNYRERICSTFTPCGKFIFSGSEDGLAYVWNTDTGDAVAVYSELCYPTALHGVAFHPHENMVAFCAFGHHQPIHTYLYDHKDCPAGHYQGLSSAKFLIISLGGLHQSGRGFKMEYSSPQMGFGSSLPPPSFMSPHSKLQWSGSLAEQLIPPATLITQSGGFTQVSQHIKRTSSLRLQSSLSEHLSSGVRLETDAASAQPLVVALYDYNANRSDELTVRRGDVIRVLYKDNESWWFGRLTNGLQGYFLASYVADQRDFSEEKNESVDTHAALPNQTPTRVRKIDCKLWFSHRARRRKKVTQSSIPPAPEAELTRTRRRATSTPRPLPRRPTGQTNNAFEPDT
ncbi:Jouberin Abelson helper integration site 1 protein -like protein [Takifugu flavidus]|uniref:Jouberin Abelson helper integration site 1 protein-like protein n=1 Tax=Takifugu flavidus TaxID=433684 RepID=A0A5C6NWE6_9TELE|nr:Jouberin Abelson helper integration site 1 protein -like protein [Takifugu flavidus]